MAERIFGHIEDAPVGSTFPDRAALAKAGVHAPIQAGISGSASEGADSIVVSGGYEDDIDNGDIVIYTGHGGNDPQTRKQVADQTLERQNLALARNKTTGAPVRVVRGSRLDSEYAPTDGFRYDGLYTVEDFWHETGRSGFRVWRYRLRRVDDSAAPWKPESVARPAARRETSTLRIVRDIRVARNVKEAHGYRCQVCGVRLETPAGFYAEAAHVRPLGSPHDGTDTEDNVLCLCPNHHILFDTGAFTIADDLTLIGLEGQLRTVKGHSVRNEHLEYHRNHYGCEPSPDSSPAT